MDELNGEGAPPASVVQSTEADGTIVLALSGELDLVSVESVEEALQTAVAESPPRLVFDLRALEFMDSSGMAVLLRASRQVETVQLRHVPPIVQRIIEVTGLSDVFGIDS